MITLTTQQPPIRIDLIIAEFVLWILSNELMAIGAFVCFLGSVSVYLLSDRTIWRFTMSITYLILVVFFLDRAYGFLERPVRTMLIMTTIFTLFCLGTRNQYEILSESEKARSLLEKAKNKLDTWKWHK